MKDRGTRLKGIICIIIAALLGALGISIYWEESLQQSTASSILTLLIFALLVWIWRKYYNIKIPIRMKVWFALFTEILCLSMFMGKNIDSTIQYSVRELLVFSVLFFIGIYPIIIIIVSRIDSIKNYKIEKVDNKKRILFFIPIVILWLLGYLAAFPGIYAMDAMTWYYQYSNPAVVVSAQWSPVYSGLFYTFVHFGEVYLHSAEAGLAIFIALQMLFILKVIWDILKFMNSRFGFAGCLVTSVFFSLVPTHMIIALQTVQGAPFMACFALFVIYLGKILATPESFWDSKKNIVFFILLGFLLCVLRNNAYYAVIVFLVFTICYKKQYRRKLIISLIAIIGISSIYKGPVLDYMHVEKGPSMQEMLSMPLQQMAYVYTYLPEKLTEDQKQLLTTYIPKEDLKKYPDNMESSDNVKRNFNVPLLQKNPKEFAKLYLAIGMKSPLSYISAAYWQDAGLLYLDKKYPDPQMWHPFINYASYEKLPKQFLIIKRHSILPAYNKLLGTLFGYALDGYGGNVRTEFSSIPFLGVFCRVSTYFWSLLFMSVYALYKKWKEKFLVLGFYLIFTLTIIVGPVVLYRYYAPVVFSFPVLFAIIFSKDSC